MALNAIYIAVQGTSYVVCREGRALATYGNYFSAWQRREAERKAAR